ncbi:glycine zipper 2TM domain-containing protein [Luteimonas sp. MHLX1A]|uniref:glycine zipper 2TM domain-containing protein n=1 Tax=Alterluteimonas muca TaxID=2878684 RepID=UPI001E2D6EB4|nr:glycine zipper 2TM domain-containing protein [Luteimonas sp. MHLX1A]MCD9046023.1 glycine zipper 2TM domain-containing protein [Luteimonas sp. MHLX1A]
MKTPLLLTTAAAAALALAGCATSPGYGSGYGSGGSYGGGYNTANCRDCGTVTRIERRPDSSPNVAGPLIGGIVGAAAGREIARRNSDSDGRRNVATGAGAVAGAVAGNAIQNRTGSGNFYDVHVRLNDGRTVVMVQEDVSGLREGSSVQVRDGRAWAL